MKVPFLELVNHGKKTKNIELINPHHIVRAEKINDEEGEQIIQRWLIVLSDGYRIKIGQKEFSRISFVLETVTNRRNANGNI